MTLDPGPLGQMRAPVAQRLRRFLADRPVVSGPVLNLIVVVWLLATSNATFWGNLWAVFSDRPGWGAVFMLSMAGLFLLSVSLFAVGPLRKPVLGAMILIAAVSSYYQDVLGVIIDREMIQNAVTTTVNEGKHLFSTGLVVHVLIRAVPGLLLLWWVRVKPAGVVRGGLTWVATCAVAAAVVIGSLYVNLQDFSSVLRERKEILASTQPLAPIGGAIRYAKMMLRAKDVVAAPLGRDARPGPRLAAADKPVLLVIVAGETARAQNWSLGGYARDTNPGLAARDVVYFSDVTSCGTATATSLPCMFSHLTRDEYSYTEGLAHENLLDVLSHAGFHVEWWDNNTGHKDIAKRLLNRFMTKEDDAEACARGECIDAVFLPRLREVAATMTGNTAIVLHQIGSHGPSYWLRYPEDQAVFQPQCESPELAKCAPDEIVNAYDNTIRYTDTFLSEVIDLLEAEGRVVPAMIYASDHGESLGEGGLYLHGAPWFMAPEEQIKVPMVIWTSPRFEAAIGVGRDCLRPVAGGEASHDHFFSTILGLVDIETEVRDDALDLTAGCRAPGL